MNIMSILNKLKMTNMLASNEEGLTLFSDCFNKFGISLLMLNDENEFNKIVDLLVENKIPLQKANGIYTLRIFAVDYYTLEATISKFKACNELDYLRSHPEILSEPKTISNMLANKENKQSSENEINLDLNLNKEETIVENNVDEKPINEYLKTILDDATLVDKLNKSEENAEDYAVTLEIQKVENKICEDFLFPVEEGWGIIIDNISVNNFQEVKENLNKLTKLSVPISASDIMKIALLYDSRLDIEEAKAVVASLGGN